MIQTIDKKLEQFHLNVKKYWIESRIESVKLDGEPLNSAQLFSFLEHPNIVVIDSPSVVFNFQNVEIEVLSKFYLPDNPNNYIHINVKTHSTNDLESLCELLDDHIVFFYIAYSHRSATSINTIYYRIDTIKLEYIKPFLDKKAAKIRIEDVSKNKDSEAVRKYVNSDQYLEDLKIMDFDYTSATEKILTMEK